MQYEGTTYRPPPEADTPLLQVTVGCAHNRCTFCDMYRDVTFRRVSMDQIEADLQEEKALIDKIDLKNVRFYGVHPTNTVRTSGVLPQDRQKMIAAIDDGINTIGAMTLDTAFARTTL